MIVTKKHLHRRTFLRGVGAAVALPLLDSMVPAFAALSETAAKTPTRLGIVYQRRGDLDLAETTLQRALTIQEDSYGPDHPELEWIRGIVEDL